MSIRLEHSVLTVDDLDTLNELESLTDTIRSQAALMGEQEVRYLVDTYYQMQDRRKASANQERSLIAADEPVALTDFFVALDEFSEKKAKQMLQAYAEGKPQAAWAMSIRGIVCKNV